MSLSNVARLGLAPRASDRPAIAHLAWPVLLALFLVNLALGGVLAISHDKASDDALSYYALAGNLFEGRGLSRDYKSDLGMPEMSPPFAVRGRFLYPFFASLAFRVFGFSIQTANLVAALFRAVLVVPLILLACRLFRDRGTGLLTALIYTFNPAYVALGTTAMPETTTSTFYCTAILLLVIYFQTDRRWAMMLGGLTVAIAYLARPEALLLVVLGVLTIALGSRRWSDLALLLAGPALTVFVVQPIAFGAAFSPYSTSLVTLPDWADFYRLPPYTTSEYLAQVGGLVGAAAVRVYNIFLFLKHTFADGLWLDGTVGLIPFTFIPALITGLLAPLPRRDRVFLAALTAFVASQLVFTIGYPGYPRMSADYRHGQVIGPFLLVLIAGGLVHLWRRGRGVGKAVAAVLGAHYALFALVILTIVVNDLLWVPAIRDAIVEAGSWSGENLPSDSVLMTRKPAIVSYSSGRPSIMIPSAGYADITDYARRHRVTHLLLSEMERSAVPNLVQGTDLFADHYRRLYSSGTFSVLAVRSYDYPQHPIVPDDDLVVGGGEPRRLYEWSDLIEVKRPSTIEDAREVWAQWAQRARKGAWGLAMDRGVAPAMSEHVDARIGQEITLLGFSLNVERVKAGDAVEVSLFWRCEGPVGRDLTVFTHALDESGIVRGQQDNPPLSGERPTSRWEMGEIVRDEYLLRIASDAPAGDYAIEAGMYDPVGGERLAVTDNQGRAVAERRVRLGPIRVVSK